MTRTDQVLTPDFYHYRWRPPVSVTVDGRFVAITWDDDVQLQAFDWWLWENAVGIGVDPATREGIVDPADLDPALRIASASIDPDGAVVVMWAPAGDRTVHHPGWLRHVADGRHRPRSWLPSIESWTAATLDQPPTHDGPPVLVDDDALRCWIDDLLRYGLARLRGLPTSDDVVLRLAGRIGPVRDTNFGPIWDVRADPRTAGRDATNSTANSNRRLGPHTDLPTRETPPGFQILHCLINETVGGTSTMTDGAAVVAELRAHHRRHYDALTTLRWIFFNRGPGLDHRWSGPLIDGATDGTPLTLRAFYPVRGFPDMAPADMPRAYEAIGVFSRLAAEPRFQLRFPFEPGDLVAFDNRRVLHGREAFTTEGRRHLRGTYLDHDEIYSFARVANRRHHRSASGTTDGCRPRTHQGAS